MTNKKTPLPQLSQTISVIESLLELFSDCQHQVFDRLSPDDQAKVLTWRSNTTLRNPFYSLRPDSLEEMSDSIFTSILVRDYVLSVSWRFFTLVGTEQMVEVLAEAVACGLELDNRRSWGAVSFIPSVVKTSMVGSVFSALFPARWFKSKPPSFKEYLQDNKTLLTVYLIHISRFTLPVSQR